jgi:triosephosphate isomerase
MKEQLKNDFGEEIAQKVPLIYGGRSTPERAEQILIDESIAGFILGSAGNTIEKTLTIVQAMKKRRPDNKKVLHLNFKAYNLTDSYEDYIRALNDLDDSFDIYISPPYTDIYLLKILL